MKCPNCQSELSENAKFCGSCGQPVAAAPPPLPQATPLGGAGLPPPAPAGRRPLPTLTVVAALAVICLIAVVAVAWLAIPRYVARSQMILYAVHDAGPGTPPNSIAAIRPDGRDYREIAHSRNGFWLPGNQQAAHSFLAPNYRRLALFDRRGQNSAEWELVLYDVESTAPQLVERTALRFGSPSLGFSPDGRRFAYTTYDDRRNEVTLHVVDERGAELFVLPSAVFAGFFSDNRRILLIQTDDEGLFDALAWVNIETGEDGRLTRLSESSGWVRPLLSPDGQQVYFYADDELLVVNAAGGAARRVYNFESQRSAVFFSSNNNYLAIYDQLGNNDAVGELRLVNPGDHRSVRIDRDVNLLSRANYHVGEAMIDFSADGSLVAYLTNTPGDLALYVTGSDGRNRRPISRGNAWLTFAFSPDGKRIAFIEGRGPNEPGSLFIADVDGSNRLRLDVDIWSFRFAPDGRTIVYSKVSGLTRARPESELYTIRLDGERRELILEAQRGLIGLLAWTR
jgi:Tol biopolymer transport system component